MASKTADAQQKHASPVKWKRLAELEAEAESEVIVEVNAVGEVLEALAQYADYMRREMPHVNRLSSSMVSKLVNIIARGDAAEINKGWRYEFADVRRWDGYDDGTKRAVAPVTCRGDLWRKASDHAIKELKLVDQSLREDVLLYAFVKALVAESDGYDLKQIFGLDNGRNMATIFIDSCSFDPRKRKNGGDAIILDFAKIASQEADIKAVFGDSMRVEGCGRFENLDSDSSGADEDDEGEDLMEDDDEEESSEGEGDDLEEKEDGELSDEDDEDDESLNGFIVGDDVDD